jgi:hypothetical protein
LCLRPTIRIESFNLSLNCQRHISNSSHNVVGSRKGGAIHYSTSKTYWVFKKGEMIKPVIGGDPESLNNRSRPLYMWPALWRFGAVTNHRVDPLGLARLAVVAGRERIGGLSSGRCESRRLNERRGEESLCPSDFHFLASGFHSCALSLFDRLPACFLFLPTPIIPP